MSESLRRCRVLVVDDEPQLAELTAELLTDDQMEAVGCESAAAAIQLAGTSTFDVLLTDVSMPGMGGVQLVQALSASGRLPAHVFFITGHAELTELQLPKVEVRSVIRKPIDYRALKRLLTQEL